MNLASRSSAPRSAAWIRSASWPIACAPRSPNGGRSLYIGQRLQPASSMAEAFLRQRQQRMGGGIAASH